MNSANVVRRQRAARGSDSSDPREQPSTQSAYFARSVSMHDREQIRRRLAMGDSDSDGSSEENIIFDLSFNGRAPAAQALSARPMPSTVNANRKLSGMDLSSKFNDGMNIQTCFFNDRNCVQQITAAAAMPSGSSRRTKPSPLDNKARPGSAVVVASPNNNSTCSDHFLITNYYNYHKVPPAKSKPSAVVEFERKVEALGAIAKPIGLDDFKRYHNRLYGETKQLLTEVQSSTLVSAHMQADRQQRNKRSWPEIAKLMTLPVSWRGDGTWKVDRSVLNTMSYAQLQLLVNDMLTQIERLNEILVEQLVLRDEQKREQDSILVDIGDLTNLVRSKS